jgi:hypothetical protein
MSAPRFPDTPERREAETRKAVDASARSSPSGFSIPGRRIDMPGNIGPRFSVYFDAAGKIHVVAYSEAGVATNIASA